MRIRNFQRIFQRGINLLGKGRCVMFQSGYFILLTLILVFSGCLGRKEQKRIVPGDSRIRKMEQVDPAFFQAEVNVPDSPGDDTETEGRMRASGLVDIQEVDASIQVYLVYATPDNFVGKILYHDIHKAFMLPETALRLVDAQNRLKSVHPELSLLVYDAARPMEVQREMWMQVRGTEKRVYVSNPGNGGGLHNYGAAVDLTLADSLGVPLPMGSDFDYFGEEARPDREEEMLKQGKIALTHLHNRRLLRKVMTDAGFRVLPSEWWHFNLMSRDEAKKILRVIE